MSLKLVVAVLALTGWAGPSASRGDTSPRRPGSAEWRDAQGHLIKRLDGDGHFWRYTWDSAGPDGESK